MKNFFKMTGLLTLICISFIYTEKTILVGRDIDDIMIKIKEEAVKYEQSPVNAQVKNDEIIPGIKGKTVDIEKSYKKMKEVGIFHSNYLEYQAKNPEISVEKEYKKYIVSGNQTKKNISLVYIVNENDDVDRLLEELKKKKTKATLFITSLWLEKNNDRLIRILNEGHVVGNYSHNGDYSHSDFVWMDTIIKKVGGQKQGYCLFKEKNDEYLNMCSLNKNYSFIPMYLTDGNPLISIRGNISNGNIIVLPINEETINETARIIWHIESKGYKIVTIDNIIKE